MQLEEVKRYLISVFDNLPEQCPALQQEELRPQEAATLALSASVKEDKEAGEDSLKAAKSYYWLPSSRVASSTCQSI